MPSLGNIDLIAEARAKEVSNFLEMLDTSGNERPSDIRGPQQKDWKVYKLTKVNMLVQKYCEHYVIRMCNNKFMFYCFAS